MTGHLNPIRHIRLGHCPSTQEYFRNHLEELMPLLPVCVTADAQTGGRGRENRSWHSPPGLGLYLSWGFRLNRREALSWVPLAVGVAVAEAIENLCRSGRLQLKWPNDILIRNRKVAGILSESRLFRDAAVCICGIGINLNQRGEDFPGELRERATSIRISCGFSHSPDDMLEPLLYRLESAVTQLEKGRFRRLRSRVLRRTRWMRSTPLSFNQGGVRKRGRYDGIAPDGGMILVDEQGRKETCYSGEVIVEPYDAGGTIHR